MAKARAIIKRRKAVDNIRKITRTMELIATNRFRKALNRATEAEAYTRKIAELVADLGETSGDIKHPLLTRHDPVKRALLLVITSNRGLAGGYNGNILRAAILRHHDNQTDGIETSFEVAGKRGIGFFRFRKLVPDATYTQFEDRPQFHEVEILAEKYIKLYVQGTIDRLDVAYTQFISSSRQVATVQTLLPITTADLGKTTPSVRQASPAAKEAPAPAKKVEPTSYEFLPDAKSILEEIVPVSFKVQLFKCFLDAAVSEQIARMVAMGGATKNADDLVKSLTRQYNRARQNQITRELADIVGAAGALE
ncbi:MAG TPA: ATP synthase F1 subunit gamma [Isosphaeraceae bacterium]|nr:ATP synthase F1 subunit gamma [Isosphaeraceae bacterium]